MVVAGENPAGVGISRLTFKFVPMIMLPMNPVPAETLVDIKRPLRYTYRPRQPAEAGSQIRHARGCSAIPWGIAKIRVVAL